MIRSNYFGAAEKLGLLARITALGLALANLVAGPDVLAQAEQAAPVAAVQAAQTTPAPTAQADTRCALHVWPSDTTHSTYFGWAHGGAIDGNRRGINGYPATYAEVLDTPGQVSLLGQIDWPTQVGDPGVQVSIHPAPTGGDDDRTRTSRLISDSGTCYQEIIIASSIVELNVMASRSVRIVGLRKKFSGPGTPPVNFSAMSMAKIEVPDKTGPDFDEKMRLATRNAFLIAVKKFVIMQSFH